MKTIIIGVYLITNLVNGKVYVGSSTDCEKRLKSHYSSLKGNRHINTHLQGSVNKHGLHNFSFDIFDDCLELFLGSFENYWCQMLNTHNRKFGYNFKSIDPNCIIGGKHTAETKKKIGQRDYSNQSGKNSYMYGKTHSEEAKKKIGESSKGRNIGTQYALGFKQSKEQIEKSRIRMLSNNPYKGKKHSKEVLKKMYKSILQYDLNGNFIKEWESIKEASLFYKVTPSALSGACKGVYKTSKGFIWKYK